VERSSWFDLWEVRSSRCILRRLNSFQCKDLSCLSQGKFGKMSGKLAMGGEFGLWLGFYAFLRESLCKVFHKAFGISPVFKRILAEYWVSGR
jgi:hypothetical protein